MIPFLRGLFAPSIRFGSDTGPLDTSGTGSPEGVVTAPVGSTFRRTDGGANTTLYRKESGAGNTGWVAVSSAGGGSSDPLDLTSATPGTPPADTVRLFRREIAGRQFPAFIGPSGLDSSLQPLIARNKVGIWMPPGNATTAPGVFGWTAPTITSFTATARNVAVTNMFTRTRRLGYVTAATAGTVGNWRIAVYQYTTGDGGILGGFMYVIRFGISDAAAVAGARMFMGMRASATPANAEPSTLTNCIGIGHGAADTNFKLFYGGTVAQTPIDLGADFPSDTRSTDVYELALFSPSSQTGTIKWEVTRLNTGHVATGTVSGVSTIIPGATTLLAPWGFRTNNATALAVAIDVMGAYIETDY